MEQKISNRYELDVIDLVTPSTGYDYFLAIGPDGKQHTVTHVMKFQLDDIPEKVMAYESGSDRLGTRYRQDVCSLLQEHYKIGHFYTFRITDCLQDSNDVLYYQIEDDYCVQNWYTEGQYDILDDVILEAKSINKSGYINYEQHDDSKAATNNAMPFVLKTSSGKYPILNGGDEDLHTEYKTSLVYSAKTSAVDVDRQTFEIVKELAAFMNADGGTLYIGIKDDTHEIVGIENDFQHLNEGDEDKFNGNYTCTNDHYGLKIRNALKRLTTSRAGSHIDITFPKQDGVTYCKIDVTPDNVPVWVKDSQLFQRQGASSPRLYKDDITNFVLERTKLFKGDLSNLSPEEMAKAMHDAFKKAINERRTDIAYKPTLTASQPPKDWIVWKKDRTWIRQKEKSNDTDVLRQYPRYSDSNDLIVVWCYASGTINIVEFTKFNSRTRQGDVKTSGFFDGEEPLEIYLCHKSDLLAIFSVDSGGTEYVKVHHLTDVNPTKSGGNKGTYIIKRNGGYVRGFKLLSSTQADRVSNLVASKRDKGTMGSNIQDINIQNELNYLVSL